MARLSSSHCAILSQLFRSVASIYSPVQAEEPETFSPSPSSSERAALFGAIRFLMSSSLPAVLSGQVYAHPGLGYVLTAVEICRFNPVIHVAAGVAGPRAGRVR